MSHDTAPANAREDNEPARRTDLLGVMQAIIVDKMTIDQLKDCPETMATYAKYPRGIQAVAELHDTEEVIDRHVEWHWGVSGSGKSTYVRSLHPKHDIYEASGFEWFNGYNGQKCIFFDDVDDVRFDRQLLLKITDKASVRLWVKNGSKICRATHIYFTSNRAPSGQWLPEQLFRRIDLIGHWPEVHPESIKMDNNKRMLTCCECDLPLVKQPIKQNKPLTSEELIEYEKHILARNQTLECRGCGIRCYRRKIIDCTGYGLCKKCGGTDIIRRPANIPNIDTPIQYPLLWACPVHGVISMRQGGDQRASETTAVPRDVT